MDYEIFINEVIMIPLKGVLTSSYKSQKTGFKNTLVTGTLVRVDEEFLYLGEIIDGRMFVYTLVPRINVGAVFTDDSGFYDGTEEYEQPHESEIN